MVTATISPRCSSRAKSAASRPSVLIRSPAARISFDGAATTQSIPPGCSARANPNPVGPASYVTATGPGNDPIHSRTFWWLGVNRRSNTSPTDYPVRAPDLRKLRGKQLVDKPGRSRHYHVRAPAARTVAALLTLRDQVIAPILAAVRSPRMGRKPAHWTRVDRHYERIRIDMQTLFTDLAIETPLAA
jgi:hypothetical protein